MLVADVSKQTITKGCAVKDFLESFVGIALCKSGHTDQTHHI